jgi:hypothetical protein
MNQPAIPIDVERALARASDLALNEREDGSVTPIHFLCGAIVDDVGVESVCSSAGLTIGQLQLWMDDSSERAAMQPITYQQIRELSAPSTAATPLATVLLRLLDSDRVMSRAIQDCGGDLVVFRAGLESLRSSQSRSTDIAVARGRSFARIHRPSA